MSHREKLEQVLELLINEETDAASELLHTVIVEKARTMYEDLVDEDFGGDEKEDFAAEIEADKGEIESDEIFDTTIEKDAKKANQKIKDLKPFVFSVGNKMLPSGFDSDIEGKEINKQYTLDLTPEEAFGKRQKELVKMTTSYIHL